MTLQMMRPTVNDSFLSTYRQVRNNLARRIQDAGSRQREHERELERCTNAKKKVQQEIASRIGPLKSQLDSLRHSENLLLQRRDELQKELQEVNVCYYLINY